MQWPWWWVKFSEKWNDGLNIFKLRRTSGITVLLPGPWYINFSCVLSGELSLLSSKGMQVPKPWDWSVFKFLWNQWKFLFPWYLFWPDLHKVSFSVQHVHLFTSSQWLLPGYVQDLTADELSHWLQAWVLWSVLLQPGSDLLSLQCLRWYPRSM